MERFIEALIDYIENGKDGYSKTFIQLVMNEFILHKGIKNDQLDYMVKNNFLYLTPLIVLKGSRRFKKLPKYLQKNIINKIDELEEKIR